MTPAFLASVVIAFVNRFAPFFKLWGKPGTITLKRFSIFVCGRIFADINNAMAFSRTCLRACNLAMVTTCKFIIANWTHFRSGRIAVIPTRLRTITRCCASMPGNFIISTAYLANFGYSIAAVLASMWGKARIRTIDLFLVVRVEVFTAIGTCVCSFQSYTHRAIIPHTPVINSEYVAVCLERLSAFGLEPTLEQQPERQA